MINNLIIIGNGFDLAHGMKTSYIDFMGYIVNEHCKDKNRKFCDNLFKLPNTIESYDQLIDIFKKGSVLIPGSFNRSKYLDIVSKHIQVQLIKIFLEDISLNNWCDIEKRYFGLLKNIGDQSAFYKEVKVLNKEFSLIKDYLQDYLLTQQIKCESLRPYEAFFSSLSNRNSLILTFNYTDTIERLYKENIDGARLIHIHGRLKDDLNPIIFGFAADNEDIGFLIDKEDNEFLRNIKRHEYKRTFNEKILSEYLENNKNIRVTILGHSCGISDKLILEQILNHINIHSIRILYFQDHESYFNTQINAYRIMRSNDNYDKIVNFQDCCRMPQYTDDPSDDFHYLNIFLNKINTEYQRGIKHKPEGIRIQSF